MATKNSTKRKRPSQRLRARALAIIHSDEYDADTRASIHYQLRTNYSDLADMVRDAEQGVTILDTERVHAEQRKAARQVIAFFELPGVPDFLTDAMLTALGQASAIEGIDLWKPKGEAEVFNPAAVTKLFALTPGLSLKPKPREALDDAVALILSSPQTPDGLFEHVADFTCEAVNRSDINADSLLFTKPFVSALLDSYPGDQLRGAIIAARQAKEAKEAQS